MLLGVRYKNEPDRERGTKKLYLFGETGAILYAFGERGTNLYLFGKNSNL